MSLFRSAEWARLLCAPVALTTIWVAALPAIAAYWTVPVDYFKIEHLRYSLAQTGYSGGQRDTPNLAPGAGALNFDATSTRLGSFFDHERGYSADFTGSSYLFYRAPTVSVANNRDAASLSFWINPRQLTRDAMLLSSGTSVSGYSLYVRGSHIHFLYWGHGENKPQIFGVIKSKSALAIETWHNIVLTQTSAAASSGPYAALYVDGVLEGASTISPNESGLLGHTDINRTASSIGSAVQSGWVDVGLDEPHRYQRVLDSKESLGSVAPFATALMTEFRYFGGIEFVCSDKTRPTFRADNHRAKPGDRCDVASDIASFAHDRLEQASYLARLPYAHDFGDHNFEGLNRANWDDRFRGSTSFVADGVRQSAASFDNSFVQYRSDVGALSIDRVGWPYALSFWLDVPAVVEGFQPIFTSGSAKAAGLDIGLSSGRIQVASWNTETDKPDGASTSVLSPGWHHVVVSFDGGGASRDAATPSGVKIVIDGYGQVSRSLRARPGAPSTGPVTIGGPDPLNGTRDLGGETHTAATFKGRLSEIQVVAAPISYAQARSLSTRFPNAYDPNFTRTTYPYSFRNARGVPDQPGYAYRNPDPTSENGYAKNGYTYDSAHLEFDVDWSKPTPRWLDESTGNPTGDCEHVLGGVRYYAADRASWKREQPASVYLCFSPAKVGRAIPPFSLALYYPNYSSFLYLTIVEPMASQDVLAKLKTYSENQGVAGLETHFQLNIGRYNMVVQAKTEGAAGGATPNYVSAAYQGAAALIDQIFTYAGETPRPDQEVTALRAQAAVPNIRFRYVDQKQLLNDLDIKFSKDR